MAERITTAKTNHQMKNIKHHHEKLVICLQENTNLQHFKIDDITNFNDRKLAKKELAITEPQGENLNFLAWIDDLREQTEQL